MKLALLALLAALAGCSRAESSPAAPSSAGRSAARTVRVSGSSALQPLINAAKETFEKEHKGVSVEVSAGGSKKGLADVEAGAVHLGTSDIFAPDDMPGLVDHRVAVVAFAAMAQKGPHLKGLTALSNVDLARIFRGAARNWKDVGGEDQPIVVVNRGAGSGTRTVFGNRVLGGDTFFEAQTEDNSGALVAKLRQTKGAISYLAMSFADDTLVTFAVTVDGKTYAPTPENVAAGAYPIWAYEHVYTKGEPTGAAKDFLDYLLSRAFQDEVLPSVTGFISVTTMKVTRDKD